MDQRMKRVHEEEGVGEIEGWQNMAQTEVKRKKNWI